MFGNRAQSCILANVIHPLHEHSILEMLQWGSVTPRGWVRDWALSARNDQGEIDVTSCVDDELNTWLSDRAIYIALQHAYE